MGDAGARSLEALVQGVARECDSQVVENKHLAGVCEDGEEAGGAGASCKGVQRCHGTATTAPWTRYLLQHFSLLRWACLSSVNSLTLLLLLPQATFLPLLQRVRLFQPGPFC